MCTLILGRDVLGPHTVLLGANRDERPARPSIPPTVLIESPRVVGGKDRMASGTWLAIREGRAAVALLNRRDRSAADPPLDRRSRGLLTLDVASTPEGAAPPARPETAAAEDGPARAALERALESIARESYAPLTLVHASPTACWMVAHDGASTRVACIEPGWHVVTHRELDDPGEPRTAHLLARLRGNPPASRAAAEVLLVELLRSHGGPGVPRTCLHEGIMVTVSSSLVWMDEGGASYRHAEGRPCEHEYEDRTPLLSGAALPGAGR